MDAERDVLLMLMPDLRDASESVWPVHEIVNAIICVLRGGRTGCNIQDRDCAIPV